MSVDEAVDRQAENVVARVRGSFDERLHRLPVAPEVELHPESCTTAGLGHLLYRVARTGGQNVRGARSCGRAGDRELALVVHESSRTGRPEQHGDGDVTTKGLGLKQICSNARRFARAVHSSPAAPSTKSNTSRGRRRWALSRRSSIFEMFDIGTDRDYMEARACIRLSDRNVELC
jgi:hypothetical protein